MRSYPSAVVIVLSLLTTYKVAALATKGGANSPDAEKRVVGYKIERGRVAAVLNSRWKLEKPPDMLTYGHGLQVPSVVRFSSSSFFLRARSCFDAPPLKYRCTVTLCVEASAV